MALAQAAVLSSIAGSSIYPPPRVDARPSNDWDGVDYYNNPTIYNDRKYISFDGIDQYATSVGLTAGQDYSLEFYIRTSGDDGVIVSDSNLSEYHQSLFEIVSGDLTVGYYIGGGGPVLQTSNPVIEDFWQHYVCTYVHGGALKLYINGILESDNTGYTGAAKVGAAGALAFFKEDTTDLGDGTYLTVDFREFRLWDQALTDYQVLQQYNSTRSRYPAIVIPEFREAIADVGPGSVLGYIPGDVIVTCNEGDTVWLNTVWQNLPYQTAANILIDGTGITAGDVSILGGTVGTEVSLGQITTSESLDSYGAGLSGPIEILTDHTTEGAESLKYHIKIPARDRDYVASLTIVDTSLNPTYTLSTVDDVTSIDEGEELTFNVTTTDVDDGTTLWWTTGFGGTNMSFGRFSTWTGTVTVASNAASFSITVSADELTSPDQQNYLVKLYKDGPGGGGGIQVDQISIDVNDTSQTRPQWTNGDATASGLSVSYRYYKFNITKIRDIINSTGGNAQISELIILNGSTKLTGGTATSPGGSNNAGEGPSKALTGYYDDKWCDTAFAGNGYSTLIIDYGTAQTSNGFTYATANDVYARDPVQWTFEGSNDGSTWTVIHEQFADATIPIYRKTLVSTVFNYPTHGSAVINQPENDYLKIDGPGTGIIKRGPDANGQDYAGGSTIFSIPFFADGVVENIPIFSGGGWTITFKNGQTRTITSVATGFNGAITYGLNLDSPLYAGANEVFPAVIKSSDFVDRPWNLGTTWTIEFWIYMNYGSNDNTHIQGGIWGLLNQGGWATTDSINIALSGGYLQINQGNNTAYYNKLVYEPTPLQWVHVAIVNNAGTNKVYYNGIEQVPPANIGSRDYTASWTNSTNPLFIGCLGRSDNNDTGGGSFDGKITNLRITNTAVYAANFYPPTTLPTKISGTKLRWTPTDLALATDTSDSAATITNNGVTYNSSYPLSDVLDVSAVFDGSTLRYYKVAGGSHFQLGTTWTIEWWQKSVDNTTVPNGKLYAVMGQYPDGGRIDIYYQGGLLKVQNGQDLCAEPPAGEWVHVALVNDAGSGTVYYNGVAQSASGNFGNYGQTQDLYIGKRGSINYQPFNGKITNIRITDTAVYTANFVPDILPTRITGHTKLLLTPTLDTVYGVDKGDNNLAIQSSGIRFNSDYPQIVVGGTITDTVTGDSGLYGIDYTTKTGVTVGSIAVKDAATLGSVSIVGTTIFYLAPCFQGSFDVKTGYDHQGTEIDNFSLYFTGNFGKTIVPVSVTINAV